MSEIELPDTPAPTAPDPVLVPPPRRRRRLLPVAVSLLFVALFAAVAWLADGQMQLAERLAAPPVAVPAVTPDQLTGLARRLDAVEQQLAARPSAPAAAPVDLQPLEARLAALEQREPPVVPNVAALTQKLDSVAAEAAAAQGAQADLDGKLSDLTQRLAAAEQQAGQLGAKAAQAQRIAQAQVALDAGAPLGDLPGVAPALARFAHKGPPTEAALRLAFPDAAAAAAQASRPSAAGKSFGERVWLRARALVTVKQGDHVLVGAPAAEVLGEAQARLDAGDLAGTLSVLDRLDGAAAQAMAPWRDQAQALLDARAALTQMAHG